MQNFRNISIRLPAVRSLKVEIFHRLRHRRSSSPIHSTGDVPIMIISQSVSFNGVTVKN